MSVSRFWRVEFSFHVEYYIFYSYVKIEYVATSFSPARTDLALKLLSNRIKVNEFAGLLNVFYIRGSTKINARMTSQFITYYTDEFLFEAMKETHEQRKTKIDI